MKRDNMEKLIENPQQVFDIKDLARIWNYTDFKKASDLARYYTEEKKLFRIRQGLYSTVFSPDILEVAQKILTPSYISYHTALAIHGINFQYYSTIHCFSERKKEYTVLNKKIVYHQIKPEILFSSIGLQKQKNYILASPERAVCDSLYLDSGISFDNLDMIDVDKIFKIAKIYNNKRLIKDLQNIFSKNYD